MFMLRRAQGVGLRGLRQRDSSLWNPMNGCNKKTKAPTPRRGTCRFVNLRNHKRSVGFVRGHSSGRCPARTCQRGFPARALPGPFGIPIRFAFKMKVPSPRINKSVTVQCFMARFGKTGAFCILQSGIKRNIMKITQSFPALFRTAAMQGKTIKNFDGKFQDNT